MVWLVYRKDSLAFSSDKKHWHKSGYNMKLTRTLQSGIDHSDYTVGSCSELDNRVDNIQQTNSYLTTMLRVKAPYEGGRDALPHT